MEELIKLWERRAEKYDRLAKEKDNDVVAQGLFVGSETFAICADELKRKVSLKQASENKVIKDSS